jgi:hypothetical protein
MEATTSIEPVAMTAEQVQAGRFMRDDILRLADMRTADFHTLTRATRSGVQPIRPVAVIGPRFHVYSMVSLAEFGIGKALLQLGLNAQALYDVLQAVEADGGIVRAFTDPDNAAVLFIPQQGRAILLSMQDAKHELDAGTFPGGLVLNVGKLAQDIRQLVAAGAKGRVFIEAARMKLKPEHRKKR